MNEEQHYHSLITSAFEQFRGSIYDNGVNWKDYDALNGERKIQFILAHSVLNPKLNLAKNPRICHASYPKVSGQLAAKLILNKPVGEGLTKQERHQWLSEGATMEPHQWLLRDTQLEARSVFVARWLLKILSNPEQKEALYRRHRRICLAEHTIDLLESDCVGGVQEAIARRADRMAVDKFGDEVLCKIPEWFNDLGGRVVLLTTAPALAAEGREMSHCVGGYAGNVKEGRCFIASIAAWGYRATVEYSPHGDVVQMKARFNQEPNKLCKYLATRAVDKTGKRKHKKNI